MLQVHSYKAVADIFIILIEAAETIILATVESTIYKKLIF
jgi:hypothetical protein